MLHKLRLHISAAGPAVVGGGSISMASHDNIQDRTNV